MHFIYLHGFCSGPSSRKAQFFKQKFARNGANLLIPDLNGGDFEHLTLTRQLQIVEETLPLDDAPVLLIGSSLGGFLAAIFAQTHPRVEKAVLMAPAFSFIKRQLTVLGDAAVEKWKQQGYLEVFHYGYDSVRRLHYGIVADAKKYEALPLRRQFSVQIFHGLKDEVVPFKLSIGYMKKNSQAHLVLLNSDHQLLDSTERIWSYLREFIWPEEVSDSGGFSGSL